MSESALALGTHTLSFGSDLALGSPPLHALHAQVGWADGFFSGNADRGEGVGDDVFSWAFDGHRKLRWHRDSLDCGTKWRAGDVIGCAIDLDDRVSSLSPFCSH